MSMRVDKLKQRIYSGYGEHIAAVSNAKELKEKVEQLKKQLSIEEQARVFFQKQAETQQSETADILAAILTSALQAAFPSTYVCEIPLEIKRNQLEARPILKKGALVIKDPVNSIGGGLIDVLSLAAKVAEIYLSGKRLVLIADEPFKAVSEKYRKFIPDMLKMLHEKLGCQFIIVSHMDELKHCDGNVIKINKGEIVQC